MRVYKRYVIKECLHVNLSSFNKISPSNPVGAQHVPEEWRQPAADVI